MTWRDVLGERVEDHHDWHRCPRCRTTLHADHLNTDGGCPNCGHAIICPGCHENTVEGEGAELCTNCEDAEGEAIIDDLFDRSDWPPEKRGGPCHLCGDTGWMVSEYGDRGRMPCPNGCPDPEAAG